ncbi:MAG: helix-turn-helix domain-containing protein [Actinomycetota bacterium]|nr:helix-turn-helix domain-containing protein [Actinomycetota bacterium]
MGETARATITVAEAAEILGVNKLSLYESIRRDEAPVPVIRIGRRIVIPKAALDRLLVGEST